MRLTAVLCVLLAAQVAACGSSEPARTPIIDDTGTALEPLPPDPAWLNSMSWLRPNGYFISGRVPEAVEAVWLERDDGLRVRTSLAHGMFEAWWRGDIRPTFVVAESAGGIELRRTPVPADFFS